VKLKAIWILACMAGLACSSPAPSDLAPPESASERLGYSIGYRVGEDFRRGGVVIDVDSVVEGALHALNGREPRFKAVSMREGLTELGRRFEEGAPSKR
jgi:hypothetical protein